mmetsp:Transcript_6337/g.19143  ORF Transcript_6337/g.19143 Transcript_6337/m.19143 type:complete len:347 (+) Transcript_6337:169-1209(+)
MAFIGAGVAWRCRNRRSVVCAVSVIAVGELLFDCVKGGECLPGGAPANVCAALVSLGESSGLLGAVGRDDDGNKLRTTLEDFGVDAEGLTKVDGKPTRRVVVAVDDEGDREFVGFAGADNTDFADAFYDFPGELPSGVNTIITGTLALAFPKSGTSLRKIVEKAHNIGAAVMTDVNWRPVFWEHRREEDARSTILSFVRDSADVVKISDSEVEFLFGIPAEESMHRPEEVLRLLNGRARGVLITGGPKGASFAFREGDSQSTGTVNGFNVKPIDTIGAGDAFVAGFVSEANRLAGNTTPGIIHVPSRSLADAVQFACATGALTTTKPGAMGAQPERSSVETFLATA